MKLSATARLLVAALSGLMTLTLSLPGGVMAQERTASAEAVCGPDPELVRGFTRQDLCVCRVYQQRAQAAQAADGMLARAVADGKAARGRADACEGAAAELRRAVEEERRRADELMALRALTAERDARRWSAWRSSAAGVCGAGLVMTGSAWGFDAPGRVTLSAAAVALVGCALVALVE